jgi:hypothetical protein
MSDFDIASWLGPSKWGASDIDLDTAIGVQEMKRLKSWAKISHVRGIELAKRAKNPLLAVLLALDYEIYRNGGRNPVKLANGLLTECGISRRAKASGLRQLEAAGVVTVERSGSLTTAPLVTSHWHKIR